MKEPLRRRLRTRALDALAGAPAPVAAAPLRALAALARFSRYERQTLDNLELALACSTRPAERRLIARGVRSHAARLLLEWTRLARARRSPAALAAARSWIERTVVIDDALERLRALSAQRGACLLVTAHLGNWELAALALHLAGMRGRVIAFKKHRDPSSDWLVRMRSAFGLETIPQDAPARSILETLRAGLHVGLLADLEARRLSSEVVPFFGRPALTMTAPAALARVSGAPLVPLFCLARGDRYVLHVDEPLELERGAARRQALRSACAHLNEVYERWILKAPEQWAWHQKRWRTPAELESLLLKASSKS